MNSNIYKPNYVKDKKLPELTIDMDIKTDCFSGIKLSFCIDKNGYGTSQLVQVLDERQLKEIINLAETNMKIPIWKYNERHYLRINDKINRSTCYR